MTASLTPDPAERQPLREQLSSFVDGECLSAAADETCRRWRDDADCRRQWHAYHLIGDVLRADDLHASRRGDAAFLAALRVRLAAEPVTLAPAPLPKAPQREARHARRWLRPVAAAAGVMAVGVTIVALRPEATGPSGWDQRIAATPPAGQLAVQRVERAAVPASAQALVIDRQLIRDARLDAYFEAHRGVTGVVPSAVPGGAPRSVEILVPQR
ncbi:MAG: sigma-E factor negative regulatory protein [Proteobacteria bacterium]|nr:sigma-E factor negative regulatory protein [Pseudomonadota bacterium]